VKIHLYSSAGNIVLKFSDEGIGIAAEDMENILHPFYRAGNVQSIPGSGLGLPLASRIIRIHGGTLTIDSVAGKGTTITVSLPVMG
jgi:signal transduction histidine kinase